jgi:uncharacterized protein (TIGR03083 family)
MGTGPRHWISALRISHNALRSQVAALSPAQLEVASYCKGWDVSQVLSHLGSGAEIALRGLERALAGRAPMEMAEFPVIWERWNSLSPADRASQLVVWDRRHVSVLEGLDDKVLSSLRVHMIGMELDMATAVGFRLGEHALHSWDVAVTFDSRAEVLSTSVELLVDRVPFLAGRLAKAEGAGAPRHIEVRTVRPERRFLLSITDHVTMSEDVDGSARGVLELPAACLLRLAYGRLDADHTPADVKTDGEAHLDELRRVFPGF